MTITDHSEYFSDHWNILGNLDQHLQLGVY